MKSQVFINILISHFVLIISKITDTWKPRKIHVDESFIQTNNFHQVLPIHRLILNLDTSEIAVMVNICKTSGQNPKINQKDAETIFGLTYKSKCNYSINIPYEDLY